MVFVSNEITSVVAQLIDAKCEIGRMNNHKAEVIDYKTE